MNPIVDRQTLEAAVAETLDRDDLVSTIPAWIRLAEATLNRMLADQEMHACVTAETNKVRTPLPNDWVQTDRITVTSTEPEVVLTYCEPHDLARRRTTAVAGTPRYYSYIGRFIEFDVPPDDIIAVKIDYQRKLALGDTPTSKNWLLISHPDAYLYGTLVHSAPYLKNDQRIQVWSSAATAVVEQINARHERARVSGSRLNRGSSLST